MPQTQRGTAVGKAHKFIAAWKPHVRVMSTVFPFDRKVKVTLSCLTLCNPMDYTVLGILQARILEWVAFPFSRRIFPTQGSNPGLPHCRQILYQLSCKGSPFNRKGD